MTNESNRPTMKPKQCSLLLVINNLDAQVAFIINLITLKHHNIMFLAVILSLNFQFSGILSQIFGPTARINTIRLARALLARQTRHDILNTCMGFVLSGP